MNIKKIIVGIDFSPESEIATQHAMNIARHVGAEVVLVHVGAILDQPEHPSSTPQHASIKEWESFIRHELAEDRQRLEDVRERLLGQGVEISHVVRDGFADTALTETASALGAELLIVGTHGRSGLKRFFLGSISERVARLSDTNVMVARALDGQGGYRRILVPTDFSAPAAKALDLAFLVAARDAQPRPRIDVIHCWQVPVTASTPYAPFKAAEEALATVRDAMAETVQESGQRLIERYQSLGDVDLTFQAFEAAPAHGIQDRLEQGNYDLVIVGSHGRRGLRRLLLGSVAELTVRHAPCSVLVAHGGPEPEQA